MPIEEISTEELTKEIERRKENAKVALRARLEQLDAEAADIRKQLGISKISFTKRPAPRASRILSDEESVAKLTHAVDGLSAGAYKASFLGEKAQITGVSLKRALEDLCASGILVRQGNARATVYKMTSGGDAGLASTEG